MDIAIILAAVIGLLVGAGIAVYIWTFVLKKTYKKALNEAARDANILKEKKLLLLLVRWQM